MKIDRRLTPVTAQAINTRNTRTQQQADNPITISQLLTEHTNQIDELLSVIQQLELQLRLAIGTIEIIQKDGIMYFHDRLNPNLGLIQADGLDLVIGADGELGYRF
ncbi:hypothetical protein RQN30_03025 [Arcanobacterium hippocoleae]